MGWICEVSGCLAAGQRLRQWSRCPRQCFLFPVRGTGLWLLAASDGREQDHQPDPPGHTSSLEGGEAVLPCDTTLTRA